MFTILMSLLALLQYNFSKGNGDKGIFGDAVELIACFLLGKYNTAPIAIEIFGQPDYITPSGATVEIGSFGKSIHSVGDYLLYYYGEHSLIEVIMQCDFVFARYADTIAEFNDNIARATDSFFNHCVLVPMTQIDTWIEKSEEIYTLHFNRSKKLARIVTPKHNGLYTGRYASYQQIRGETTNSRFALMVGAMYVSGAITDGKKIYDFLTH